MEKYTSNSAQETKDFAGNLIKKLLEQKRTSALVVGLCGELGAGKTQFVQGVAKHLGIKRNITSPTFVLMKKYSIPSKTYLPAVATAQAGLRLDEVASATQAGNLKPKTCLYHIDCYRTQSAEEFLDLDWKDIIVNPNNIIFVEWAEKIKKIMPKNSVWIYFKDRGENKREFRIHGI